MMKLVITIESSPHPTLADTTISSIKMDAVGGNNATDTERQLALLYSKALDDFHKIMAKAAFSQTIITAHGEDECKKAQGIIDGLRGHN